MAWRVLLIDFRVQGVASELKSCVQVRLL